jgi:hypothetical protein
MADQKAKKSADATSDDSTTKKPAVKKSSTKSMEEYSPTDAKSSTAKSKKTSTEKTVVAQAEESFPAKTTASSRSQRAQAIQMEELVGLPSSVKVAEEPRKASEGRIVHDQLNKRPPINGISIYRQARDNRSPIKRKQQQEVYYQEPNSELPAYYGITRVQVFVKDTEWLFAYWDISQQDLQKFPFNSNDYKLVLRLLEVDKKGSEVVADEIAVSQVTTSWYVHIPSPGRSYKVQLGLKNTGSTEFLTLATSGAVTTPSLELVTDPSVHYGDYDLEAYRQLLKMSGAGELADHLSSGSFSGELVSRLSLAPSSFSASVFSGSFLSSAFTSETLSARTNALLDGKNRKFWLVIDAEVIVYGATEPDAQVSFMGKPIRLNPDGTFGVRMALPDGKIEFPVVATSADGVETKTVRPVVTRKTEPR